VAPGFFLATTTTRPGVSPGRSRSNSASPDFRASRIQGSDLRRMISKLAGRYLSAAASARATESADAVGGSAAYHHSP
jgi:hypothetical protein